MLIVGLQCGHDAAVTVLADGKVLVHLERERKQRERHAGHMSADLIDDALAFCGLTARDIDYFALCTTQSMNYGSTDGARLKFDYDWATAERIGETLFSAPLFKRAVYLSSAFTFRVPNTDQGPSTCYNIEWPAVSSSLWHGPGGMDGIDALDRAAVTPLFDGNDLARSNIVAMRVTFDGVVYPAVGVMHQLAHGSAAFFQSPFDTAPVLSHDNGSPFEDIGYRGGMLFHGQGNRLVPIWRARIAAGLLYARTAWRIKLGGMAGPGKLMGLSAYGQPEFHSDRFIGDAVTLSHLYRPSEIGDYLPHPRWEGVRGWFAAMERAAVRGGYDPLEDPFSPLGHQVAASMQKTFEELVLYTVERLQRLQHIAGRRTTTFCLSGGCALNCPTNSRIVEQTQYADVFIPPSCDDGGLSTGAALYLYHHVLGHERVDATSLDRNIAHLGRGPDARETAAAIARNAGDLVVEEAVPVAERAAADLADDKIIAVFNGRAESGPRALGNRSLLADPRRRETWDRVNRLKGREWWRPFAPACLSERLRDHFDGGPSQSPHMLFNYRVKSADLGAVTHVDGTARAQTVGAEGGTFREIIERFDQRTGIPVVLNTSFNGPGEPIVDTADDAIRFLLSSEVDALYLESHRLRRRNG